MNVQVHSDNNLGLRFDAGDAALDITVLDEMEALLGRPKLLALLTEFRTEIVRLLLPDELTVDALSRNAHALASASGMLGFTDLSRACVAVEEGVRRQDEPEGLFTTARDAGRSALDAMAIVTARLA